MASNNRDIKMRVFLDAAAAEKAYNTFMRNLEANNKRIQELRDIKKQKKSLSGAEEEELKQLQSTNKVYKMLLKETKMTYNSIVETVKTKSALTITELEGYIKETRRQLKSLQPGKDDAELAGLARSLGIFERELADRNKQILQDSQRTFKAILTDINTSQATLASISSKGIEASRLKDNELKKEKDLSRAQTLLERDKEKYKKYNIDLAAKENEVKAANNAVSTEALNLLNEQFQREQDLYRLEHASKKVKAKPEYVTALEQTNRKLNDAKTAVANYVAANKSEEQSVNELIRVHGELTALRNKPVGKPNEEKRTANINKMQTELNDIKRNRAEADRIYAEARKGAGKDAPYQQSIDTLRRLYTELEAVRNKETEVAARMDMTAELQKMEKAIAEMEGKRMSMAQATQIANNPTKASVEDLKKARQAMEEFRLTLKADDTAGLQKVDSQIRSIDHALITARENAVNWQQTLNASKQALTNSNNLNNATSLERLKMQYEQLKQARDLVTEAPARNSMNEMLFKMEQQIKDMQVQLMTGKEVNNVYRQSIEEIGKGTGANSAKLRENIELMKVAQQSKDIDANTHNKLAAAIKASTDLLEREGHSYLSVKQASAAYANAKNLIAQGDKANVDAIRATITALEQSLHIEGITLRQERAWVSMKKELTDMLTKEVKAQMDAAAAASAYTTADNLYRQGINADAAAVRASVDAMKQAQLVQGITVETEQKYYAMEKQLTELLQNKVKSLMDSAQAQTAYATATSLIAQGANADATAVRASVEAMKEAQKAEGILVQDAQNYYIAEKQLTDLLQAKAATIMNATQAQTAYTTAENLYRQGINADAAAVRASVDAMKQAQLVQGITVETEQKYYAMEKQLTELLQNKVKSLMDSAQAQTAYATATSLIAQGANADATAVRASVEAMKEAQKVEGVTVEQVQLYYTAEKQLTDLLQTKRIALIADADAENIYNNRLNSTVGEIKNAIEYYRAMANQESENVKVAAEYAAREKELKDVLSSPSRNPRALADIQSSIGSAKSISELTKLREELKSFISTTKDLNQLASANDQLRSLNSTIAQMEASTLQSVQDVLNNLTGPASRQQMEAWYQELKKIYETTTNAGTASEAAAGMEKVKRALDAMGTGFVNDAEKANALSKAEGVLANSATSTVGQIKEAIDIFNRLANQTDITAEESQKFASKAKALEEALRGTTKAGVVYDETFVKKIASNPATASLGNLETAIKMCKERIKELTRDTQDNVDKFNKESDTLKKLEAEYEKAAKGAGLMKQQQQQLNRTMNEAGTWFTKAATKLMNYVGIFGGMFLVRQKVQQWFKANIEYSDALTNIQKTTQMTTEAINTLARELKFIDTRTGVKELNDLAYAAGKLGVKGVQDVLAFVRAADQVKIALGEQLGDSSQAIEQIYKITNVMGTQQEFGMEDSILRVGSAINHLTMNTQATAQPMVDMMKRLAGVASQAGMSASELAGWAGAVNALGQNVELSATSLSRTMVQLSKHHTAVAKALKMNAEETNKFYYDIAAGHISDAMLTLLRKANEAGGLSHLATIMKDISGSDGARVIQTLSVLSARYGEVARMVKMSNEAFAEGTSVTNEYNIKNNNAAALWEKLKNQFSKMVMSPAAVEWIRQLLLDLQTLPNSFKRAMTAAEPLVNLVQGLVTTLLKNANVVVSWIEGMLIVSVIHATSRFTTFITLLNKNWTSSWQKAGAAVTAAGGDITKTHGKIAQFSNFLRTQLMGNILTIVAVVGVALYNAFKTAREEAEKWNREIKKDLAAIESQSRTTTAALNKMQEEWKRANDSHVLQKGIIDELNTSYGAYIDNLLTEATSYEEIAQAIQAANNELRAKAILEGKEAKMNEVVNDKAADMGEKLSYAVAEIIKLLPSTDDINVVQGRRASIETEIMKVLTDPKLLEIIYKSTYDSLGRTVSYANPFVTYYENKKVTSQGPVAPSAKQNEIIGNSTQEFVNASNDIIKTLFNNFEIKLSAENIDTIRKAMLDAANIQADINKTQNEIESAYNARAAAITNQSFDYTFSKIKDAWENVKKEVIGPDGRFQFSRYTDTNELHQAGEAMPYNGEPQDNYYVDLKDAFGEDTKARVDLEQRLERYIENAQRGLQLLSSRVSGTEDPAKYNEFDKQYQQLKYEFDSAYALYKILGIGKIEDANEDKDAAKKAKDLYDSLIEKIKEFFEIQEKEIRRRRNLPDGNPDKITEVQFQRMGENVKMWLDEALSTARRTILGRPEFTQARWEKFVNQTMANKQNLTPKDSYARYDANRTIADILATGNLVKNIGAPLRKKGSGVDADGNNYSAVLAGMSRAAQENETNIMEVMRKRMEEIRKIVLEDNPVGKLMDETRVRLEKLDLTFVDMTGKSNDEISKLMSSIQNLGAQTVSIDIDSDSGFEQFLSKVKDIFPTFEKEWNTAQQAITQGNTKLAEELGIKVRALYYESYRYNQNLEEAIAKMADKHKKLWDKMYQQSTPYEQSKKQLESLQAHYEYINRRVDYGYSKRYAAELNLMQKRKEAAIQTDLWNNRIKEAQDAVSAANEAVKSGAEGANERLTAAQMQLEIISREPDQVRTAVKAVNDAIRALEDANDEWVKSSVKAFDTFMDGFVPFRSWYEHKGDFIKNVFGTKEERQKAFGQFMDDIKKTIRQEAMERVRQWMTKKADEAKKKKEEEKLKAEEQAKKAEKEKQRMNEISDELSADKALYDGKLDLLGGYFEEFMSMYENFNDNIGDMKEQTVDAMTDNLLASIGFDDMLSEMQDYYSQQAEMADGLQLAGGDDIVAADAARRLQTTEELGKIKTRAEMYDYLRPLIETALRDSGYVSDDEFEAFVDQLTGQAVIESVSSKGFSGLARKKFNFSGMTNGTATGIAIGSYRSNNAKGTDPNNYAVFDSPQDWARAFVLYLNEHFDAFGHGVDKYGYQLIDSGHGKYATAPNYKKALAIGRKAAAEHNDSTTVLPGITAEQAKENRETSRTNRKAELKAYRDAQKAKRQEERAQRAAARAEKQKEDAAQRSKEAAEAKKQAEQLRKQIDAELAKSEKNHKITSSVINGVDASVKAPEANVSRPSKVIAQELEADAALLDVSVMQRALEELEAMAELLYNEAKDMEQDAAESEQAAADLRQAANVAKLEAVESVRDAIEAKSERTAVTPVVHQSALEPYDPSASRFDRMVKDKMEEARKMANWAYEEYLADSPTTKAAMMKYYEYEQLLGREFKTVEELQSAFAAIEKRFKTEYIYVEKANAAWERGVKEGFFPSQIRSLGDDQLYSEDEFIDKLNEEGEKRRRAEQEQTFAVRKFTDAVEQATAEWIKKVLSVSNPSSSLASASQSVEQPKIAQESVEPEPAPIPVVVTDKDGEPVVLPSAAEERTYTTPLRNNSAAAIATKSATGAAASSIGSAASQAVNDGSLGGSVLSSALSSGANAAGQYVSDRLTSKKNKEAKKKEADDRKRAKQEVALAQETEDKKAQAAEDANVRKELAAKSAGAAMQLVSDVTTAAEIANSNTSAVVSETNETEKASTSMFGNLGRALTAAWAEGGPYLGPVLASVVSAAVGGIITMIMNMLGGSSASTSAPKTKLVSGMLTYDNGNVQSFGVRTYDNGGKHPVMGDNGKVYWVDDKDYGVSPETGMVTRPTLTSIGGQPALVAENGPEMVIGRETTRALALNEPEVLRTIMRYDSNHSRGFARTFDEGTAGSLAQIAANTANTGADGTQSANEEQQLTQQQLVATIAALSQTLTAMQQQGIQANLNMYGAGGAVEKMAEALYQTKKRGNNKNVNRLFG